ncbi:MAG: DEAD/DEAH box helicase family protein, partial [Syntrophomonadaceae bacterium]|nr:DEAD/DEAH box helicase family protein [Syntrophomonadaceae bacterium]
TIGVATKTLWHHFARFNSGQYFNDHDFHVYLEKHKIEREPKTEWFNFGPGKEDKSEELFMKFTFKKYDDTQKGITSSYELRAEQEKAVQMAYDYAKNNPGGEFLWNAKPRFGKTLSAYDLARRLDARTVLIVTNRPAIANSWFDDFEKFIAWKTDYKFVSESESLKNRQPLSVSEFADYSKDNPDTARRLEFISLQDLKGSVYHGGQHDKLHWVSKLNWDLLIIDEAHEGIDTLKTDIAFNQIKRKFTLHLSGTPFKAIAKGNFSEDQIFNWSYTDEQEAKNNWDKIERNPYEELPKLNMFTYQMSNMIMEEINKGAKIDGKNYDYAFDLNEFFATNDSGKFIYEDDVVSWLNTLTTNEKYPFSTDELRNNLKHTFWILNRVNSAKALATLLRKHPVFKEYEIVVAAGDGRVDDMIVNEKSLDRVKKAIKENDKTITLSVGQLTTGVTIPEWSAVMMLSNMESPALYMQAAFRAQNPHKWVENINGKEVLFQKENAYVFDFSPERTLIIFDNFANDLNSLTASGGGTSAEREDNIKKLLNFFPVIGEDLDGVMKELDYSDVLTIPKQIKATEVVKRGFMSNLLFANISRVFAAPQVVLDTLNNLKKEDQGKLVEPKEGIDTKDIELDSEGQIQLDNEIVINKTDAILGDKIFGIEDLVTGSIDSNDSSNLVKETVRDILNSDAIEEILNESKDIIGATNLDVDSTKRKLKSDLENELEASLRQKEINEANAKKDYEEKISQIKEEDEKKNLEKNLSKAMDDILEKFKEEVKEKTSRVIENTTKEFVENQERKKANKEKSQIEDDVRSRLRGFARTIPSFIMAYGEKDLTLANFDSYIPDHVFKEVTGITIDQFKFLRDGGEYEEEGE